MYFLWNIVKGFNQLAVILEACMILVLYFTGYLPYADTFTYERNFNTMHDNISGFIPSLLDNFHGNTLVTN